MDAKDERTPIADAGEEREPLAAWRIFTGGAVAQWMDQAGIAWPAAWCILRISKPSGLPDDDLDSDSGDIDVLAGRLLSKTTITGMSGQDRQMRNFLCRTNGQRFSNPEGDSLEFDFSYLVGIELKCAYVTTEQSEARNCPSLKSLKHGPGKQRTLRGQLESLLKLGLDKVIMLDLIAGIPSEAKTLGEAFAWAGLSTSVVDREHRRLNESIAADLPIGHIEMTVGPVQGQSEDVSGFCRFTPRRDAPVNPQLNDPVAMKRRHNLVEHVKRALNGAQIEHQIPVILDLCPRCGRLARYHGISCSAPEGLSNEKKGIAPN